MWRCVCVRGWEGGRKIGQAVYESIRTRTRRSTASGRQWKGQAGALLVLGGGNDSVGACNEIRHHTGVRQGRNVPKTVRL
jgi:hypothetical protein